MTPPRTPGVPFGPLEWVPFRRLFLTQIAQAAGDALVAVSLASTLFFSVPLGEARDRVALYLLVAMAPYAVLSPVVGPLLDRVAGSHRLAVQASSAGRAILALWLSTRTDRLLLFPLAFALLVLSRVHGIGRSALVPESLPPEREPAWGNAWLTVGSVVAGTAAALPGAGLAKWLGPRWPLLCACAVFASAAVLGLRLERPAGEPGERPANHRSVLGSRLLAGGVATAAARTAVGFLVFFLAFRMRAEGIRGIGFGAVLAAAGAGSVAGAALSPMLRRAVNASLLMVASLLAVGVTATWASAGLTVWRAGVVAAVCGMGSSVARLTFDGMVQARVPALARGRVFARYETIFQLFWVGGAGFATAVPLGSETGTRFLAVVCFTGIVVSIGRFVRTGGRA